MKKRIIIALTGIMALCLVFYYAYPKISKTESSEAKISNGLTSAQKETDFRYLTSLGEKVYPFNNSNVKVKGLSDILPLSKEYIKRAGRTKNDTEFMKLVEEYITRMRQTGHAYVYYENSNSYVPDLSTLTQEEKNKINQQLSFYNIDKGALNEFNYWASIHDKISRNKYAHPEIKIMYTDGKYIVTEPCKLKLSGKVIKKGAEIESIDGYPADEYVKRLQAQIQLGFDSSLHKLFLSNPLVVRSHNSTSGWKVCFKQPDGSTENALVSESYESDVKFTYQNVITEDLGEDIGYIKISSLVNNNTSAPDYDKSLINDYIKESHGKYKKLIIDLRGNGGGSPEFLLDSVVAPLIKKPIVYTQTAAVKKSFFKLWGRTVQQYLDTQYIDTPTVSFINKNNNPHLQEVTEVKNLHGYDDSWVTFKVTHMISPKDTLPFSGKVYLLVDGGSFSASEDFAQFCKRTGFAEVVGNNTGGGAASFIDPFYFCLPESKIIFRLEVETSLNPDGTMSEILGTEPDIKMEIKPTPVYSGKETLMNDEWIRRIKGE